MTDKIKNEICETIKSTIDSKGHILLSDLNKLFDNNKKELFEVIEELKDGQVVRTPPARHSLLPGLKYKSFKTYQQFIDEMNNPPPTVVEYKTKWYDWLFRGATAFGIASTFYFSYNSNENEKIIHGLRDSTSRQSQVIDSLSKEVLSRDTLLLMEKSKLKKNVPDSLGQGVKIKK